MSSLPLADNFDEPDSISQLKIEDIGDNHYKRQITLDFEENSNASEDSGQLGKQITNNKLRFNTLNKLPLSMHISGNSSSSSLEEMSPLNSSGPFPSFSPMQAVGNFDMIIPQPITSMEEEHNSLFKTEDGARRPLVIPPFGQLLNPLAPQAPSSQIDSDSPKPNPLMHSMFNPLMGPHPMSMMHIPPGMLPGMIPPGMLPPPGLMNGRIPPHLLRNGHFPLPPNLPGAPMHPLLHGLNPFLQMGRDLKKIKKWGRTKRAKGKVDIDKSTGRKLITAITCMSCFRAKKKCVYADANASSCNYCLNRGNECIKRLDRRCQKIWHESGRRARVTKKLLEEERKQQQSHLAKPTSQDSIEEKASHMEQMKPEMIKSVVLAPFENIQ